MKATITISDDANGKCTVDVQFDPPLPKTGTDMPAGKLAMFVLEQIKENSKSFKQTMSVTRS